MDLTFCYFEFFIILVLLCPSVTSEVTHKPSLVNFTQVGRTSAVLKWSPHLKNNDSAPVQSYEILYHPSEFPSQVKRMTMMAGNGQLGVRFNDLSPNTRYVVQIRATTAAGKGAWIFKTLTVLDYAHPRIFFKPKNHTKFEGSTVIFRCKSSGFPIPHITWLFNGKLVSRDHLSENGSLVIRNVARRTHEGRYTCMAINEVGKVSTSASLFVYVKLFAYVPRREYILSLTSPKPILTCYGSGYPRPNITWTKNGLPVSFNQTDIFVNETLIESRLNLGNFTLEKGGNYTCHLENGVYGQNPVDVLVQVLLHPIINVKPVDQKVFEGSTVLMHCKSSGLPTPNITWLFNDKPVPWGDFLRNGSLVLKRVTRGAHDGRYTCVATSKAGRTTRTALLLIYVKLSAHAPTREYILSLTSPKSILTCYGSGYPRPNITWTKNGLPVSFNETNIVLNETFIESRLNLGNVTMEKGGNYTCHLENGVYGQDPISIVMETLVHPVISIVPINQTKIEGSDVIFICESSGVPVPTVKWLINGAPIPRRHTIDRRGSLILKNVTHGTHDGRYTCMAANKAGTVFYSAHLTVYTYPVFDARPSNQKKAIGSTVVFPCAASGFPRPSVKWLFNGKPIPWKHSLKNSSLVIRRAEYGIHEGRYTCSAINKAGTASTSASLLVYVGASAQAKKRRHVFSLTSEYVILSCYGRGYPLPNITWTKNGLPVSLNQTDNAINETFIESKLNLGNFTHEKAGNYSCYVRNWLDGVYIPSPRGIFIEALLYPIIVESPSDQNMIEGSTVVFECKTSGVPQPTNTWLFNEKPIPFDHSIDKGSLVIENVTYKTHAGKYTCVASSKAGKVSHSAWLFIAVFPSFVVKPISQSVLEGTNVIFKCEAKGVPKPTITWLFNDQPVTWEHVVKEGHLHNWDVRYGTHNGRYTCAASNRAGKVSSQARLTVYKACPNGWSEGPSSCYRIVTTPTAKWDDARKSCISMGGYLVKINSDEENRLVGNLASKSSSKQYMWIGLSKISRSEFHWTDGTSLRGRYSKWNDGEPNNAKGNENCAHMFVHGSAASSWNDHLCNFDSRPFFACERGKRN